MTSSSSSPLPIAQSPLPDPNLILSLVARDLRVTESDLRSSRRGQVIRLGRAIVTAVLRAHTDRSYPDIAALLGRRPSGHSTIQDAHRRFKRGDFDDAARRLIPGAKNAADYARYVHLRATEAAAPVTHDYCIANSPDLPPPRNSHTHRRSA